MLFLLLVLVFVSACRSENEAPSYEEEITVYTTWQIPDPDDDPWLAHFYEKYPEIKIELVTLGIDELMERLFNEKENPIADVVWGLGAADLLEAEWNDILFGYTPTGYERIESEFRDTVSPPFWVGIQGSTNVFCVNPEKIEALGTTMPRSWQDLLHPTYKGEIAFLDPQISNIDYTVVAGLLLLYGESDGWQYIDQLYENLSEKIGDDDVCQMVANGDFAIGIDSDEFAFPIKWEIEDEEAEGSLEIIFPTEGLSWQLYGVALVQKEQINPAAKTFLEWTLSDDLLELYSENYALVPGYTNSDHPISEEFPPNMDARLLNMEFAWLAANRENILAEWGRRYGEE